MKFLKLNLMILGLILVANPLLADDKKPTTEQEPVKTEEAKAPVDDDGFATYFNAEVYGKALIAGDAVALTDVALTLAEGERVLLRTHKGVTADAAFQAAVEAAKTGKDSKTLGRIEKFAKAAGNQKLQQLLALSAPSRGNIPHKVILFNRIQDAEGKTYSINIFVKLQYQQNGQWVTYNSYGNGIWYTIRPGSRLEFTSYRSNDRLVVTWDAEGSSADNYRTVNLTPSNPSQNWTYRLSYSQITRKQTGFWLFPGTP